MNKSTKVNCVQGTSTGTDAGAGDANTLSSAKIKKLITRHASTIFEVGSRITAEDCNINGSRLPTSLQVLHCLMYHLNEGGNINRTRWESAMLVLPKIKVFYEKVHIPMISDRKACKKMIKLLDDNAKLREIPCNQRSFPGSLNKVKQMEELLTKTFPLWPANAEKAIKNAEDLAFLQSMKGDHSATFGSHDKAQADKVKHREKMEEVRHEIKRNEMNTASISTETATTSHKSEDDHYQHQQSSSSDSDDITQPGPSTRSHHCSSHTGTTAFIPHDIIKRPRLVALATRLKMTPAQQAAYTAAFIE